MRLRKIEIFGFKTFPEKTILNFQPGITCIVGPNGCGKSNVVDAILWVMGEQSTKTLRGERMEDVIFFGSETRKTLGMSEVTLTIGDIKGDIPSQYAGYSEIEITRRLYRSGESEYLINKVHSRLKDIRDILIDAGIGFKGHSVIEQGRIEKILTSTPEDRRAIIEDTAGIMKYKYRKTEALRKLEATEHNLLRVRDIISEVKRQINSLDRQVKKAKEYQEVAGKIREKEITLHAIKYASLENALKELLLREEVVREDELKAQSELLHFEAQTEETRTIIIEAEKHLNTLRQDLFDLDKGISENENRLILIENQKTYQKEEEGRLSSEIVKLREDLSNLRLIIESLKSEEKTIDQTLMERESAILEEEKQFESASQEFHALQDRLENTRADAFSSVTKITEVKNRQTFIQSRTSELYRIRERILSEKDGSSAAISENTSKINIQEGSRSGLKSSLDEKMHSRTDLSARQASIESRAEDLADRLSKKREALHRSEARYHSLEEMEKNLVGYQEGVRSILLSKDREDAPFTGIRGIVADIFEVRNDSSSPYAEKVIEAVLGERLQNLVMENYGETKKAINFLKSSSSGRTAFIPVSPRNEKILPQNAVHEGGVIGPAMSLIDYREGYQALAEYLFANVLVVDTMETALNLWEKDNTGCTFATIDGEIIEPSGRLTGGVTNGKSQGLIGKRRELRTLQNEVLTLKQEVSDLENEEKQLKRDSELLQNELEGINNHIRNLEIAIVNSEKDISILKDEESRLRLRVETLSLEEREIDSEIGELSLELTAHEAEIQLLSQEQASVEQKIQSLIDIQKNGREVWENAQREITAKKLDLATFREKKTSLSMRHREIEERIAMAIQSIGEKEEHQSRIVQKLESHDTDKIAIESAISDLWQKKEALSGNIGEREEERLGREEQVKGLEEAIRERRTFIGKLKEELTRSEVQKAEIRSSLGHMRETMHSAYEIVLEEEIKGLSLEGINADELTADLAVLKEKIHRMGPVNLASIEEYQELNQRYEFMIKQEGDLTQACDTLHKTISKINMTTKEMFLTTFNIINEKFQNLFQMFFQGGNSRLSLTDENNVLESGIEIFAQPPGKKVSQLALLSGGEKALTALSLLFATFLARPTPFCVLDEIDAPLDEVNTERFTRTLRDMTAFSQFIVVTHNKRTMESADILYGITMEDPGVSRMVSVNLSRKEWAEEIGLASAVSAGAN